MTDAASAAAADGIALPREIPQLTAQPASACTGSPALAPRAQQDGPK